jgi:hypothetical protein
MPTTKERIEGLSDQQVVEVTQELFNVVYTQVPFDVVRNNSEGVAEVDSFVSLKAEHLKQEVSAAEAAHFGRLVLHEYASNPELAPFVQQALEKVENSDDLIVGTLLAVGIIVNLTLLVATTSVTAKKDANGNVTWDLGKKAAEGELVGKIIEPFAKIATAGVM